MDLLKVYKLWDIEPVRGLGTQLWDKDGVEYTDLYGGHAVISIGHCHPHYVKMLSEQARRLGFYSNAVQNSLQKELASRLGRAAGMEDYTLFLCNSGAEANENALKMASFKTGRGRVIAFRGAFHGRTSGAVAVTDNYSIQAPYNRNHDVTFVHLEDVEEVERELSRRDCAAVIIEGIQGVSGIHEPSDAFLRKLRELCDIYNTCLILDEVQSGYGRSGNFYAHQRSGVRPDFVTSAKGMGNGFPIGALLCAPHIKPETGMLGTTFGGNHLACTAALAVLDVIESEHLIENAARVGEYFRKAFEGDAAIAEYRGRGLMIGLEIKPEFAGLRDRLLFEEHFFTGAAGPSVIRLLPSLTITEETAARFVASWKKLTGQI